MATNGSVSAEARRAALIAMLKQDGGIRLTEAAEQLGVSEMTVRRDLDDLDAAGLARRVRGGAVPSLDARPYQERRASHGAAKLAIARKAATLVPASGAIAIDASSTAGALAPLLDPIESLLVVTNSAENFAALTQNRAVSSILTGGELDPRTGSFVGHVACQAAASILSARFFASAAGVDARHGSSEVSLAEVQVKRAFAAASRETVLLVDSAKLDEPSISVGFGWDEVALLVTELDPGDTALDPYRDLVELL